MRPVAVRGVDAQLAVRFQLHLDRGAIKVEIKIIIKIKIELEGKFRLGRSVRTLVFFFRKFNCPVKSLKRLWRRAFAEAAHLIEHQA